MRVYFLSLACLVSLAGCDRNREEQHVTVSGGSMSVSGNGAHMSFKDASGQQTVEINSNGGAAPANLPSFVTIYPGAKVQSSVTGSSANGNGGTIVIQTSASIPNLIAYYQKKSAAAGFGETMNMATGGTTMFTAGSKDNKRTIEVVASASKEPRRHRLSGPAIKNAARRSSLSRWVHALRSTHEFSRQRARWFAVAIDDFARHDRRDISPSALQQPLSACGQVERHPGALHAQTVEIDDIDVGLHARRDHAAIVETDRRGRVCCLPLHEEADIEATPRAIPAPVREQIGRIAGI